jgi:hypothetical protein
MTSSRVSRNPADLLGVEQDDHCGDPGAQGEFVIGEKVAEQGHAVGLGQRSAVGGDGCW